MPFSQNKTTLNFSMDNTSLITNYAKDALSKMATRTNQGLAGTTHHFHDPSPQRLHLFAEEDL